MNISRWLTTAIGVCLVAAHVGGAQPVSESPRQQPPAKVRLTVAEFDRLHRKLTAMSTEKVWSIPWQLSVREARELAARENKPVFLWISSNGGTHPLGPC